MYFRELINILFSHYYINIDLWTDIEIEMETKLYT